ncbi:hypothetical protein GTZ78_10745, partial [Streptomyces sp. SID8361]|uniref:carboxymuconolactone decarboxylase family protein n=1 Tax=Streptomyces sp. MnatMP-M27 TaxID=1839768 RepID=UPI00144F4F21
GVCVGGGRVGARSTRAPFRHPSRSVPPCRPLLPGLFLLTALVARGHYEELAMHVRAALRNGLTPQDIQEVLLQSAIYCGVPTANAAFAVADRVLAEIRSAD